MPGSPGVALPMGFAAGAYPVGFQVPKAGQHPAPKAPGKGPVLPVGGGLPPDAQPSPKAVSDDSPVSKVVSQVSTDGSPITKTSSGWDGSQFGSGRLKIVLDDMDAELRDICERIDTKRRGYVSKLELVAAAQKDPEVAAFILPKKGFNIPGEATDEEIFDAVMDVFDLISQGKQRIKFTDLAAFFAKEEVDDSTETASELARMFDLLDADKSGSISKFEMFEAVKEKEEVATFLLPHLDGAQAMESEEAFNTIDRLFQNIACGKKRIEFADFEKYFKVKFNSIPQLSAADRAETKVLVIGPGFGQMLNPRQSAMIQDAGYQVNFFHGIPNPEMRTFDAAPYLEKIKAEIDVFQPHVVASASKGGIYLLGLWEAGYWRGPSLLLNAHPRCKELPQGVPVVVAHGSNDEVYPTTRDHLEKLIATGTENMCFLYHTADSGRLPTKHLTRKGDKHNMESLLVRDMLPRLIDATLCPGGPEAHMIRTWRERISQPRLEAETWLGHKPEGLRKRWATSGVDEQKLFEVPKGSEEWTTVETIFWAEPKETPVYGVQGNWDKVQLRNIQRVENLAQLEGCAKPYFESLGRNIEEQGVEFDPELHTSWAFHGGLSENLESIVSCRMAGFQPLAAGSRGSLVWGSGTYFAREARYVSEGGFCGKPNPDGTRQMLLCLLMTGLPCLGDPQHKGDRGHPFCPSEINHIATTPRSTACPARRSSSRSMQVPRCRLT